MSSGSGAGRGGTALFASPGRPRGVAFAPAVRGYPGGIADMASDPDELGADEPLGDGELWPITAGAEHGDAPGRPEDAPGPPEDAPGRPEDAPGQAGDAPDPVQQAGPIPGQPTQPGSREAQPAPVEQVSVWQQSAAAWREARIDWLRSASAGAGPAGSTPAASTLARPASSLPAEDGPHTEPLPVITADAALRRGTRSGQKSPAAAAAPAGRKRARAPRAGAQTDEPAAGTNRAPGTAAAPETAAAPGGARRGRRLAVAATAAVILLAGTIAAIGIARSGSSGPAGPTRPEFALATPYPPASPADADFASRTAAATPLLPSLAGIAAAGQTVIAFGAQPSQPAPAPLMLLSTDGGHTWTRATVTAPSAAGPGALAPGSPGLTAGAGPATGPGPAAGLGAAGLDAAPAMIARSGSTWLALGQHAAWTSPDGKVWQPVPGTPEAAGDKVLGLAATGTGFVAVGEHTGSQPGPVVWTTTDGQVWQRESGPAHGITARGGHVAALRWAAAVGGVIVAGGRITAAAKHRPATGLWRSTDGGRTWDQVKLPATHGATSRLAGLATNGSTFLAVRPGRAGAGRKDAVAYLSAHGSRWSYAGKLAVRRISMRVTTVAGSGHGLVVAGVTRSGQLTFFSKHGHGWRRLADPGSGVAGLTAGPDGNLVVARNSRGSAGAAGIQPRLLLVGARRRQQVGQSVLTAAASPDITINALASAGQAQVAAGAAGGAPALWLASPSGQWAPAGLQLPAPWRSGALLSVAHGGSGWLTVGQAGTHAPDQPVILMSASGTSWTTPPGAGPPIAPGSSLAAVAAGPAGYVVVGSAMADGRPTPAAWFSADLSSWALAPLNGPADGGQMLAVTAARSGFVAAGAVGGSPVVWTSTGGSDWRRDTLPRPAGAGSATLTTVTAIGDKVVAIGSEHRSAAAGVPVPFAAVSADGGRTWRESVLPAPPSPAVVTALTAAGRGFVAVGHPGLPGQPGLLTWWSANGVTWHFAGPAGGGAPGPYVTQLNAVIAGNGTLTGAGFAASGSAEHPVLWHARYR